MTTAVFEPTLGAVKSPALVIVPAEEDHFTLVFAVPWIIALNCWVAPGLRVTLTGVIEIVIVPAELADHAPVTKTASSNERSISTVRAGWLHKWTTTSGSEVAVRSAGK